MKTLRDIGEKELIHHIVKNRFFNDLDLDDAALLQLNKESLLITSDQLFEKPFLRKAGGSYADVGHLFVTQNISDIAAMGGTPLWFLSCITAPGSFLVSDFNDLLKGIQEATIDYEIQLVGGETKEGSEFNLCGTAVGIPGKKVLRRIGCAETDLVCISGVQGSTFANYIDFQANLQPKIKRPKVNIQLAKELSSLPSCTSCMDLSDGLFSSLQTLSDINNLSVLLDLKKIPVEFPTKVVSDKDWLNFVLNIGGDFELLFTLSECQESWDFLERNGITMIGKCTRKIVNKSIVFNSENSEIIVAPWQHFSNLSKFVLNFDYFLR